MKELAGALYETKKFVYDTLDVMFDDPGDKQYSLWIGKAFATVSVVSGAYLTAKMFKKIGGAIFKRK